MTRAGGADKMLHFGSKVTRSLRIRTSFEDEVNGYEICLSETGTGTLLCDKRQVTSGTSKTAKARMVCTFDARCRLAPKRG